MKEQEHYVIEQILRTLCKPRGTAGGGPEKRDADMADVFLHFMDEMPGGFLIYYAERGEEIIYANQGLLRMFGCGTQEEFRAHTGNSFRGIVHPDELEAVEESIKEQIASSQYDLDYVEYRIRCKDGSTRWIEDYGHYVDVENVGGIFYVFLGDATRKRERQLMEKNRTDQELLQQQLEQQNLLAEALAEANQAISSKNTFLSNISHDMRTPLHAIFGFTSLAKLKLDNQEEVLDYLNRVETASRQLLDLINKVLEASALSSDSAGVEESECSLRDVGGKVYSLVKPQAQEKSLDLRLDCGSLCHSTVFADRDKLHQMLLYLANNAVSYTDPGGQVTIAITEQEALPDNYAVYRFVVRDTGIGISPEFLERIFEPFTREKNSTFSGVHGVGLGLTIAKNIVDMLGGRLSVESKVGEGSTFTAVITFRYQDKTAVQEPAAVGEGSQRILLVEDNEINSEIEVELLARLGFAVDPAENGKVALDKIIHAGPKYYDLVLMDLQMPVMDGWETAVAIRALPDPAVAKIPIIALSANILQSDQRRSKECGINAHLVKPMDLSLLLDTIEKLTGKRPPKDRRPKGQRRSR